MINKLPMGTTEITFAGNIICIPQYKDHLEALEFAKKMSKIFNIRFTYKLI